MDQNQDAKRGRESLKIVFRFSQKGPQDTQNQARHPPRAPSSRQKPHVTQQVPKKSRKSAASRPKEAILGPEWDPKKSTKKRAGANKKLAEVGRKRFSSISCTIVVRNCFPARFWEGLNLENHAFTTVKLQFSQNHRFHFFLQF